MDNFKKVLPGLLFEARAEHYYRDGHHTGGGYGFYCFGKDFSTIYRGIRGLNLHVQFVYVKQPQDENIIHFGYRKIRFNLTPAQVAQYNELRATDDFFAPPAKTLSGVRTAIREFTKITRDGVANGGKANIYIVPNSHLFHFRLDETAVVEFNGQTGSFTVL